MLRLKSINEMEGLKVYTELGDYYGDIEEAFIQGNKVYGWKIKATRNSFLNKTISGARGVIVPHQLVKATSDVMIISKAAIPSGGEEIEEGQ